MCGPSGRTAMPYQVLRATGSYAARYAAQKAKTNTTRWMRRQLARVRRYGTGVASGRGNRRTTAPYSRFSKAVRKVILNTTESCYKSASHTGYSFYHDTLKAIPIWDFPNSNTALFPSQGLGDGERIGDEIYVTGMMIRGTISIPHDRRNTRIKMWWVPHNTSQGNPVTQADFQHNVTGNTFIDPIQTDRWPGIKYLGMVRCSAVDQTTGSQDKTIFVKKWIPMYRKVTFNNDGEAVASNMEERGYLVVSAYDTISSAQGLDQLVLTSEWTATLYYKCP